MYLRSKFNLYEYIENMFKYDCYIMPVCFTLTKLILGNFCNAFYCIRSVLSSKYTVRDSAIYTVKIMLRYIHTQNKKW